MKNKVLMPKRDEQILVLFSWWKYIFFLIEMIRMHQPYLSKFLRVKTEIHRSYGDSKVEYNA